MNIKKILMFAMTGILALGLVSCGGNDSIGSGSKSVVEGTPAVISASPETSESSESSDLDYIKSKNKMVIGYTLFAPMNYMQDGELIGFETEFAKAVCNKLGVEAEFQEINWDSKEIELNSKAIDCIWNGMTINDERKENMSVTIPYMCNRQVLVVRKDKASKYDVSVDDASVVAEAGSAGEEICSEHEFFKNIHYTAVDSQAKGLMEVKTGVSDAVVLDYIMALGSVGDGTDYADLVIVDKNLSDEEYGAAFRKGSDVTAEVNKAIKELSEDGTLKEIADKYKLSDLLIVDKD